jgi:hypothetical protein
MMRDAKLVERANMAGDITEEQYNWWNASKSVDAIPDWLALLHKAADGATVRDEVVDDEASPLISGEISPPRGGENADDAAASAAQMKARFAAADAGDDSDSPDAEEIRRNLFDTIDRHKAVVRVYKKVFKHSTMLDQESQDEICCAIGKVINMWRPLKGVVRKRRERTRRLRRLRHSTTDSPFPNSYAASPKRTPYFPRAKTGKDGPAEKQQTRPRTEN